MDYQKILKQTKGQHDRVLHIILDTFQRTLRVTFPAIVEKDAIIEAAEQFHDACSNSFTISYHDVIRQKLEEEAGEEFSATMENEEFNRPFNQLAAEWPHYVIPPGHPYEVLDPSCPCSFFEA